MLKWLTLLVGLLVTTTTHGFVGSKTMGVPRRSLELHADQAADDSRTSSSTAPIPDGKKVPVKLPGQYGEMSRRYRRTHFGHPDWPKHRSDRRFFNNLLSLPSSGIVRQVGSEVLFVVGIATFVILWNCFLSVGWVDFEGVKHEPFYNLEKMFLPITPFTIASPALSLLLVFRTNSSYDRWWEARKAWGSIINHTRNTMRTAAGYNYDEPAKADIERVAQAVYSFPRSLMRQLIGPDEDDAAYIRTVYEKLRPDYAKALAECRHKPTRSLHEITLAVADLPMDNLRKVEVDRSVVVLADATGICERIFSTPVPLVYTRHASRFLTLWMLGLPFAMWDPFVNTWNHIGMLPAVALIAFFFFGIEEIAIQLEEPFSILALQSMTNVIELSCKEYYEWFMRDNNVGPPMPAPPAMTNPYAYMQQNTTAAAAATAPPPPPPPQQAPWMTGGV